MVSHSLILHSTVQIYVFMEYFILSLYLNGYITQNGQLPVGFSDFLSSAPSGDSKGRPAAFATSYMVGRADKGANKSTMNVLRYKPLQKPCTI